MKVLMVNKHFYLRSGADRYLFQVKDWLEKRGDVVIPFAMTHPKNESHPFDAYFPSEVQTHRVRFDLEGIRVLGRMMYSFESRASMACLVADTRPDLCHMHSIYTQLSPSILAPIRRAGVPIVMTVHDHHLVSAAYNISAIEGEILDPPFVRGVLSKFHKGSLAASAAQLTTFKLHKLARFYERHVQLFLCPSMYMVGRMRKAGFDPRRVVHLPYGIDISNVVPDFGHRGYVFFAGRLSPEKGIEHLIDVARLLPDVPFKVAGTGIAKARLKQLAEDVPNMTFVGYQSGEALEALFRGAMAVVAPSTVHENAPLSVLEAQGYGVPVLASDVGGVSELLIDGETGYLLPPQDVGAWVEAVLRLVHDDELRTQMAHRSREHVETTFPLSRHFEQLDLLYKRVLQENK